MKNMKTMSAPLLAGVAVVAALIGFGIGYSLTPQYRGTMSDKAPMDLGLADRWVDARYANAMIAHHRAAMLVAEQAVATSERPEIKELGAAILKDEPARIDALYAWKLEWYGDRRAVRDPAVPRLGAYDATWDLRFLNYLVAHHEAGIAMTTEARHKTSRAEIMNDADGVEDFLKSTLVTLRGWRAAWYPAN